MQVMLLPGSHYRNISWISAAAHLHLFERCQISRPVEIRAGIGLAHGRDIRMARYTAKGISPLQTTGQTRQCSVLAVGKGRKIAALEFDADGKIIAARAALPA